MPSHHSHHCPNCQSEIPEQAVFCPACGHSLKPEQEEHAQPAAVAGGNIACPRCQTVHPTGSKFCENCGYPLTGAPPPEKVSHPPQESADQVTVPVGKPVQPNLQSTSPPVIPPISKNLSKRRFPRWIFVILGVLLVAAVGYLIWDQCVKDGGENGPVIEACVPEKPGEDIQEANQNDLEGNLREDSVFKSGQEYTIATNAAFTIPDGMKLIIEPGALIRFGEGSKMVVSGTLSACGRSNRRILFTADALTGRAGFWSGIEFVNAEPETVLGHATIEFAGKDTHAPIWVEGTDINLQELKFDTNQWYAISIDPDSMPLTRGEIKVENGLQGWEVRAGQMHKSHVWSPEQTFIIRGRLEVQADADLTIKPGTWVKFLKDSGLVVYGELNSTGSADNLIIYTSVNEEGEETDQLPAAGDWAGLFFVGEDSKVTLDHVKVRYAGGETRFPGCIYISEANPVIRNSTVDECAAYYLSMDINSQPEIEGISLNAYDPIYRWEIRESQVKSGTERTIPQLVEADGKTPINPVISGWLGVEQGAALQVEPGTVLLFSGGNQKGFWSEGKLNIAGTENDPVILTSWLDARFNPHESAEPGDWAGLYLTNLADGDAAITNTEISYAGGKDNSCLLFTNSSSVIDGLKIADCSTYPISSDAISEPQISSLNLSDNQLANQWEIKESNLTESSDWEWDVLHDKDDKPIIRVITGNIKIGPEAGLTLKPGVILKFASGKGMLAQGSLHALGEETQPIIFTSWQDLEGGGSGSPAQPGDWAGLALEGRQSSKNLENVQIRYAGVPNRDIGCLNLIDSNPSILNLTISNCNHYPITSDIASDPIIDGLQFSNNSPANDWAIRDSTLENGQQLTWDSIQQADNSGEIARTATGWLHLDPGTRLTLNSGTILKFNQGIGFFSNGGALVAEGSPDEPVFFTSHRDPQFSSNGGVQAGDWIGLILGSVHGDTTFKNVEIRYAGGNDRTRGAVSLIQASPTFENLIISDSAWYPVSVDMLSNPQVNHVTFENNLPADAIEIRGSQLDTPGEQTWSPWYDANGNSLVRVIMDTLTIGDQASLRMEPGTLLKFNHNAGIDVYGSLHADEAVFTSLFDDTHGGDTDGGANEELLWQGIRLFNKTPSQFEDSLISFGQFGMWLEEAALILHSMRIENSDEAALSADANSEIELIDASLTDNEINGILMRIGILPPGDTRLTPIGENGNYVTRVINEMVEVGSESQLIVDPGVVLKFTPNSGMLIDGKLQAGQEGNEWVYFTSLADDTIGGDTDSLELAPNRGSWLGLETNSKLTDAQLELIKTEVRYATNGIYLTKMPEWFYEDLSISDSQFYGVSCDELSYFDPAEGNVTLSNNGFETLSCPTPDRATESP